MWNLLPNENEQTPMYTLAVNRAAVRQISGICVSDTKRTSLNRETRLCRIYQRREHTLRGVNRQNQC